MSHKIVGGYWIICWKAVGVVRDPEIRSDEDDGDELV
jgi:hypothetical protein